MNCVAGMNWKACTKTPSPLALSSTDNTAITDHIRICPPLRHTEGKENSADSMETKSWLSKVCDKLRSGKHRPEKCVKCGQRSDTCLPNPSFISGRKHFLCGDCRVSSRNMKTMYQQLCRNLSLRDASRTTTCTSGDLSSPHSSLSPSPSSLTRSKSLKVRPTSPESGYDTATSLDSSSSSDRLSADPVVSTSSGECGRCCTLHPGLSSSACSPAAAAATHRDGDHEEGQSPKDTSSKHVCHSRTEVFGGAFKSERVHLQRLQQFMAQEWVHAQRQSPAALPQHEASAKPAHAHPAAKGTTTTTTAATKQYDGYLEIRTPNSRSVKYVFKKPEGEEVEGHCSEVQKDVHQEGKQGKSRKQCYRCLRQHSVAFRAPFGHGWLCEGCMDDLM